MSEPPKEFKNSKVTVVMNDISITLRTTDTHLTTCNGPLLRISAAVTSLDGYAQDAEKILGYFDFFLDSLNKAMWVAEKASGYIPEVGEVIKGILSAINKMKIMKGVETAVNDAKKIVKQVRIHCHDYRSSIDAQQIRDKALKTLASILSKVQEVVRSAMEHLPNWHASLATLSHISYLIDVALYVFAPGFKDGFHLDALENLEQIFTAIKTSLRYIGPSCLATILYI